GLTPHRQGHVPFPGNLAETRHQLRLMHVDTTTDWTSHLPSRCPLPTRRDMSQTPGLRLNRLSSHACSRGRDWSGGRKRDGPSHLSLPHSFALRCRFVHLQTEVA